jgi:hypothetical protein
VETLALIPVRVEKLPEPLFDTLPLTPVTKRRFLSLAGGTVTPTFRPRRLAKMPVRFALGCSVTSTLEE